MSGSEKFVRVVYWTIAVEVLSFLFGFFAHFIAAFHLLTGWLLFVWRMLPVIQINPGMIFSSLLSLGVAVWLLHLAVKGICLKTGRKALWPLKNTVAVTTLILVLFGAAIVGTGIGHQIAWMNQERVLTVAGSNKFYEKSKRSFTHNVWGVLKQWADAHGGHYPSSLHELVPNYIDDLKCFSQLYFWSPVRSGPYEPWIYLGASLTTSDPGHLPLLVSPRPFYSGHYVLCRNDGSVTLETPENHRKAMADWRAYSAKSERTPK